MTFEPIRQVQVLLLLQLPFSVLSEFPQSTNFRPIHHNLKMCKPVLLIGQFDKNSHFCTTLQILSCYQLSMISFSYNFIKGSIVSWTVLTSIIVQIKIDTEISKFIRGHLVSKSSLYKLTYFLQQIDKIEEK